jgi:hypothetical protein
MAFPTAAERATTVPAWDAEPATSEPARRALSSRPLGVRPAGTADAASADGAVRQPLHRAGFWHFQTAGTVYQGPRLQPIQRRRRQGLTSELLRELEVLHARMRARGGELSVEDVDAALGAVRGGDE